MTIFSWVRFNNKYKSLKVNLILKEIKKANYFEMTPASEVNMGKNLPDLHAPAIFHVGLK